MLTWFSINEKARDDFVAIERLAPNCTCRKNSTSAAEGRRLRLKIGLTKFMRQSTGIHVSQKIENFRVPSHNDVEGADYYHDFKKVSVPVKRCNRALQILGILRIHDCVFAERMTGFVSQKMFN